MTLDGIRWGLMGGRGDRRGLAVQGMEAARNLRADRVLGLDMGDLSPQACDWSGYDPATLTVHRLDALTEGDVAGWMDGLDVVFGCETFYRPWVTGLARRLGVATVLQVNPEFAQHVYDWLPLPDVVANPTSWRNDRLPGAVPLPVGVARDRLPWRRRERLSTVLHVIGTGAAADRNGTRVLMAALRFVARPLGVVVRCQRPLDLSGWASRLPPCVDVETRSEDVGDYARLYDEGDLLVQPRRYGGLHLPALEALSTGMPVLMPDCPPNSDLLPPGMLVACEPARPDRRFSNSSGVIDLHDTDATALGQALNRLAVCPDDLAALSDDADRIAARLAWPRLERVYADTFRLAVDRCRHPSR